uniref:Reverse transcriptase domain-containing protein n=1 Tax=Xenopus tropicalis TaxID=8364 RepID=A0A803K0M0_XENTR
MQNAAIRLFKNAIESDMKASVPGTRKRRKNLTYAEKLAIDTLRNDITLIIRPADKGGGIVLLNYDDYKNEVLSQLSDGKVYKKLLGDPVWGFKSQVDKLLKEAVNNDWITQTLFEYLTQPHTICPVLYSLPKIHKSLTAPPGRPIVSARDSLLHPLGIFLDHILQPVVQSTFSYLRDTPHFLECIQKVVFPKNTEVVLATIDVVSLYTSIPHIEGLAAVQLSLEEYNDYEGPPVEFILNLLELCLKLNYFRFETQFYQQLTGTAMGASMAPAYANLFMHQFENKYILPKYGHKMLLYKRFIDDICIFWVGDEVEFLTMVQELNLCSDEIKFTASCGREVQFLDLQLTTNDNRIDFALYRKITDRNSLLHATSAHAPALKRSLPVSQFSRVLSNNSDAGKCEQQLLEMKTRFLQRGYDESVLRLALAKAKEVVNGKRKRDNNQSVNLVFSTSYNEVTHNLGKVIRANWAIIRADDTLGRLCPNPPTIGYRRGKNLRDLLVVSDPVKCYLPKKGSPTWLPNGKQGCFRCPSCMSCRFMTPVGSFFPSPYGTTI